MGHCSFKRRQRYWTILILEFPYFFTGVQKKKNPKNWFPNPDRTAPTKAGSSLCLLLPSSCALIAVLRSSPVLLCTTSESCFIFPYAPFHVPSTVNILWNWKVWETVFSSESTNTTCIPIEWLQKIFVF